MLTILQRLIGEDIDLVWQPYKKLLHVKGDPSQMDQVLANLCVNSRDAIAGVGKITIETANIVLDEAYCIEHSEASPGEYVLLTVSDNGKGMNKKTLKNLFEPFFTTKEASKGTGLGMSTVYGIIKQNDGIINVFSEPGHGTKVKIFLPRNTGKVDVIARQKSKEPIVSGNRTILLVEDEPAILKVTTIMLEEEGYIVRTATSPREAIHLVDKNNKEINLLMTDVVMPEMNGQTLANKLKIIYPNLKLLFMSGYTADVIASHGVLDEGVNFIQKPFTRQQLAMKLSEILKMD